MIRTKNALLILVLAIIALPNFNYHNRKSVIKVRDADRYDGPELAARMEMEHTKDPATGKVPRQLLLEAIDATIRSKSISRNNPTNINSLTWTERGPNTDATGPSNGNTRANSGVASGRVRAVCVDSSDITHKTVFIGSVDGGIWKTTDITTSPANWVLVNDYLSNLAVSAICQDPRPGFANNMYFCTGESFFNFDAVQGNGVFKSTDGGATWNFLASTSNYLNCTRILCDFLGNVYLATRGNGILRSVNGGTSWTNITPSGFTDFCDMKLSSTSVAGRLHVVAGIFSTQAYFYTDIPATVAAATWTSPITPFPSYSNRAEIACSGLTLYSLPSDNNKEVPVIYKSIDGGVHWAAATAPNATWASAQGWYALAVAINPADATQCIVGGLDTWKSINAGASWNQISTWLGTSPVPQYVHADVHNITWYDGGNKMIFASDGGIFYSGDGGVTIRDRNTGLRIKQFFSCAAHPTTTNYFLAGAQDNGVHQFSNAGLSSTVEVTGGDGAFVAIDQAQPQYQFGSYVYNEYRRSVNGGISWSYITLNSNSGQFINPFEYDNTAKIIYAADNAGTFRRWTDPQTGSTSAVIGITAIAGKVTTVAVSPYTANRAFFGTSSGKVVLVDNANTIASGSAGVDKSAGLPSGTVSSVALGTDDQTMLTTFSNYNVGHIWLSTNGGTTWVNQDGNLPNMPVRWSLFIPGINSIAYVATETGVWETTQLNGATTVWTANNTFPTVRTDMIRYRPSDHAIIAATHGRGLWTAIVPVTTAPEIQFQTSNATVTELTTFTIGCIGYTDYTYNMSIANPPSGTATVTLLVVPGGTATQNQDYAVTTNGNFASPSMTLTFANGSTTPQPFTVRVYDDANTESLESFSLNYSISGTTNALPGPSFQTFTLKINDNDLPPVQAANLSATAGSNNMSLPQPFRGSYRDAHTQLLYSASELTALGLSTGQITSLGFTVVTKNSTQPYTGFTIGLKNTATTALSTGTFETGATQVYSANYSTVLGLNTLPITSFTWDGVSNVLVDLCYSNLTGTLDDLVAGSTSDPNCFYDRQNTGITSGCSILSAFYTFTTPARPLLTFAITVGTPVAVVLGNSKSLSLGPLADVYFYDLSGKIMARVKNLTAFDYGCTQVFIDRSGITSGQFWNNTPANYLASKSFRIIPTNNTTSGVFQVTLYYAQGEVAGWQSATGQVIGSAQVIKVSNGFYVPDVTPANSHVSDVIVLPATIGTFGTGNIITSNLNASGFSGFGIGYPCSPVSGVLIWTGASNTTWANAANWSCGTIPTLASDVQINNGLTNYPVVNSNVSIKSLVIKPGASVTVNTGFTLTTH